MRVRDSRPISYRLHLIAASSRDLAEHVGGLAVDYSLQGWRVTATLLDASDVTPLTVLGVTPIDNKQFLRLIRAGEGPQMVAAFGRTLRTEPEVADGLRRCVADQGTEVRLWGPKAVADARSADVHHVLSSAARAFKAHALVAAGAPGSDMTVREPLWSSRLPVRLIAANRA